MGNDRMVLLRANPTSPDCTAASVFDHREARACVRKLDDLVLEGQGIRGENPVEAEDDVSLVEAGFAEKAPGLEAQELDAVVVDL